MFSFFSHDTILLHLLSGVFGDEGFFNENQVVCWKFWSKWRKLRLHRIRSNQKRTKAGGTVVMLETLEAVHWLPSFKKLIMLHKLLKEKFEELVAWVWNPSFAWVKQHWYKTIICYLLYSVTTNYEIEMWLFLYLELVSTVQQVRTGCTKIWSECPWSLHSRHVFKLWRNIVTFNSKLSFVCHICNSIPDFVTPKVIPVSLPLYPKSKYFLSLVGVAITVHIFQEHSIYVE